MKSLASTLVEPHHLMWLIEFAISYWGNVERSQGFILLSVLYLLTAEMQLLPFHTCKPQNFSFFHFLLTSIEPRRSCVILCIYGHVCQWTCECTCMHPWEESNVLARQLR